MSYSDRIQSALAPKFRIKKPRPTMTLKLAQKLELLNEQINIIKCIYKLIRRCRKVITFKSSSAITDWNVKVFSE